MINVTGKIGVYVMSTATGYNGGRLYSDLVKPVLIDCSFQVDSTNSNGLGISNLKGSLVRDVFMYTNQSAGRGNSGILNPMAQSASQGYALIKLKNNYARYAGHFAAAVAPVTGSNLAINASALTVGVPYVITAVGHATAGAVTIQPVADSSGSLASTWFRLFDGYGNTFIIWFSVSGVGSAPSGVSGTLVQQSIATGDTAATIGAALVNTINNLPSGVSGVFSFTAAGTTTVTVTSTQTNPYGPLPGAPQDGVPATGFTFAVTKYNSNLTNWQTVGVPKGVAPAVGVSFIAIATGQSTGGGSTGTVKALSSSGITRVELLGDPTLTLNPQPIGGSPNVGGYILVQFLGDALTMASYTPAGTITNGTPDTFAGTPAVLTGTIAGSPSAPADGSVVKMSFYVELSSVVIAGI